MSHIDEPSDDGLADGARAMLAAYRKEEALPADVRAQVWSRLDKAIAAAPPERATPAPADRMVRWAIVGTAIAAAVAALWWGRDRLVPVIAEAPSSAAYDEQRGSGPDAVARIQAGEREAAPSRATTPAEPPAALLTPTPVTTPSIATPSAAAPDPTPAPTPPGPRPTTTRTSTGRSAVAIELDTLDDETELVRAAQNALTRGDARHALDLLDAGEKRFGKGMLTEERAAVRALALCRLDRSTRGTKAAATFEKNYPRSPLLPRVRAACIDAGAP